MLRYSYTTSDPLAYDGECIQKDEDTLSRCEEVSGITWMLYVDRGDMTHILSRLPEPSLIDKTFHLLWTDDPREDPVIGYVYDMIEKRRYVFLP